MSRLLLLGWEKEEWERVEREMPAFIFEASLYIDLLFQEFMTEVLS